MITTYFRSSSFNCHTGCPQQYLIEYILGWKSLSNQAADRGTIFHKCMEIIAKCKKAIQDDMCFIEDEIIGHQTIDGGGNFITMSLDIMIERVYTYYAKAFSHHTWTPQDLKKITNWVHDTLKCRNGHYNPLNRNIRTIEQHFNFALEYDWAQYEFKLGDEIISGTLNLTGTIDLILNEEEGLEILDWKTGATNKDWNTDKEKNSETMHDDPQFLLYALACSKLYPNESIIGTIYFVQAGGPVTIVFDQSHLEKAKQIIKNKFELIKKTTKPYLNKSWKCSRFCGAGKTTFENTHIPIGREFRDYQVTKKGVIMSKCEQTKFLTDKYGLDWVMQNMKASGHQFNNYKAPGEV